MSDSENQNALALCDISDREGEALQDEAANLRSRVPPGPNWPHSRVLSDDSECARNLAHQDYAQTSSLCFVPICRVVQIATCPCVELNSQISARSQSKLDSSAHFRPVFELGGSVDHLARAPIELFQPCCGRIGVFGFIEALNQLRRKPCAFASG